MAAQVYGDTTVKRLFGVRTPMRDGVQLASDIWLPDQNGKHPLILVRTPYLKTMEGHSAKLAKIFTAEGYAFAVQDVRGRGDSDGVADLMYFQEGNDGYDTIEWLAAQPWSNGKICMMGVSYLGAVQWYAAREKPPHLVCIAPTAPSGDYHNELPYNGGAFRLKWALYWANTTSGKIAQEISLTDADWPEILAHRPLIAADEKLGRKIPLYRNWLTHGTLDDYWRPLIFTQEDFNNIDIPALHTTGWFDDDQAGPLVYWQGMAKAKASDQYLIIGPWDHVQTFLGGERQLGEMEFSDDAVMDTWATHLAFFDYYLKGTAKVFDFPRAKIYITGKNEWREFSAYPVPGSKIKRLYLSSGGQANTLNGNGKLISVRPDREQQDHYTYDPENPISHTLVGDSGINPVFAADHRPRERRDDVLVYTSDVLDSAVEIIGKVSVELYAASDASDTDFTASITDVYPDGRSVVLGSKVVGVMRARYRNGMNREELLTPGKVEKYIINLGHIGHSFMPGHRIRVEISSSAAPFYNPNQNTGNPVATDTEWKTARQTIYHGNKYPSALVLPAITSWRVSGHDNHR